MIVGCVSKGSAPKGSAPKGSASIVVFCLIWCCAVYGLEGWRCLPWCGGPNERAVGYFWGLDCGHRRRDRVFATRYCTVRFDRGETRTRLLREGGGVDNSAQRIVSLSGAAIIFEQLCQCFVFVGENNNRTHPL